jgi:trimethylamine--corrinoid protein Co-methyltransferase
MEAGITLVLGALSGADIFGHLGISGVDQASSLAMLVMQDEVIGYVERIMKGIEISEEKFGFDAIESVVSEGGLFLSQGHTVQNFRKELWFPTLLDRQFWQAWRDDNAKDMMQRCIEKKNMLLETHIPESIDSDTQKEIDKVINHARHELAE